GEPGREKPGVLVGEDTRLDVSAFGLDYNEAFFESDQISALESWISKNREPLPRVAAAARLGPPICRPSKIVCVGLNFRDHAAESGAEIPTEPVLFLKSTSSLAGPFDSVVIPGDARKLDWEVELAVLIKKKASYVEAAKAAEYVAGYALHNDYSERSF